MIRKHALAILIALCAASTGVAKIDGLLGDALEVELEPERSTNAITNPGFENGKEAKPEGWTTAGAERPTRSNVAARTGAYCLHVSLKNEGKRPCEGITYQPVPKVDGGKTYVLSFWIKQISAERSYVQEYKVDWLDEAGRSVGSTRFKPFTGKKNRWSQVSVELKTPATAASAHVLFRFVTGAVEGGHGEAYIDDLAFHPIVLDPSTGRLKLPPLEQKKAKAAAE